MAPRLEKTTFISMSRKVYSYVLQNWSDMNKEAAMEIQWDIAGIL